MNRQARRDMGRKGPGSGAGWRLAQGPGRSAFTLTEVIVIVSIIVLFMALAVPAINVMRGKNSVAAARNQVAAVLTRARLEAMAMQRESGVLFFLDPDSGQYAMASVAMVDPPAGAAAPPEVYLDLVADRDMDMLPAGVGAQVLHDCTLSGTAPNKTRSNDGYIGYNRKYSGGTIATDKPAYGGVILFGGEGQVVSKTYAFRGKTVTNANTAISVFFGKSGSDLTPSPSNTALKSGPGFVLYERGVFADLGYTDTDDRVVTPGTYSANETSEEKWLDANGSVVLINRTSGALVKSD